MIDTVRTLAQPYSHYLMAHRDLVIVLMGLVVMWTVGHDLLTRWRNQRLTQDMAGRGDPRSVVRRTYATTATAEKAAEAEAAGALPPVRGGRTYARNLGNALQKAGMGPAPIYTPPPPVGWGSGPTPAPGRGAPPPTYAPPSPPWATPAPPPMQPGPPRPAPAPGGATPWPTYVPPSGPVPGQPQQPSHPFFQPPFQLPFQQAAPAAPPAMPPVAAPAPAPQVPLSEPVPPPLPSYIPAPAPVAAAAAPPPAPVEPPTAKAKPKRKRFSLAVLQNLEKTLQRTARLGESAPVAEAPQAWTPPPAPAATPAVSAMGAAATVAEPVETPAVDDEAPVSAPEDEQAAPTSEAEETTVAPPDEEAPASPAADYSRVWEQPQPAVSDSRAAMRAMLFGEDEKVPAAADETWASSPAPSTEPEEAVFRFEPVVAEPEPAPSSDEAAPVEETSPQPAAIDEVESPAESATEPLADPWRTEPLAETTEPAEFAAPAAPAADESEEPLFSPAATEPAGVDTGSWSPPPPEGSEMQTGGDRGNLVIIEDDQAVAEYYATLFRGNGYSVYVATDGISGVDLCAKVKPAVILLDVMMPRQNGMLVLQTLRASDETKETPVVVLSNFSEPTLVKRALQLGALEYVIKTQVEGAALLDALPRWMNREKAFAAA